KPEGQPRTSRNIGMYRAQLLSKNTTAMHWHVHHDGARHWRAWKETGQPMPLAIAFGGESVLPYAATAPMPPGVSELLFAGFLNQGAIPLVRCKTIDLEVPARAEIVLEGYVVPGETRAEGPFGDHTGYYSPAEEYPVFHVTALTHRRDPIYPTTVVGRPPSEDFFMGKASERIMLPALQTVVPEVVDMNMPAEGIFTNYVLVSIRKEYPGQARKVMYALWGIGQMMLIKGIVVFDGHVDVQDLSEVAWRVGANVDPSRDLVIVEGAIDDLEHASATSKFGSKIGIDATTKSRSEGMDRDWPSEIVMSEEIKNLVDGRWKEYGI
ncbi:MAG: UbiD family decarboxylase, partial [SAR202 cluster bacterium]|nr:UbiD family decarboxylase [SAR202 cluster bacterium]